MNLRVVVDAICVMLLCAMFGWAALFWPDAPDRFPMHWNSQGEVDRWGGRAEGMLLVPVIAAGVYALLLFLPRIDPGKANYANMAGAYAMVRLTLVGLMVAIYAAIQAATRGRSVDVAGVTPTLLGLLFLVLGNVMGKLRPNWFVGIRTPWTLSSAESWTRTHRAGGWVFIGLGFVTIAAGLLAGRAAMPIMIGLLMLGTLGLVVYSYIVWKADPEKIPPAGRTAA